MRTWALAFVSVSVIGCGSGNTPHVGQDASPALPGDAPPMMPLDAAGWCPTLTDTCLGVDSYLHCTTIGQPPDQQICSAGCVSAPAAHCARIVPSGNALVMADLAFDATLADIHVTAPVVIDTDTGAITGIRTAGTGVISGIAFDVRGTVGVFRMHDLLIDGDVTVAGANAIAVASYTNLFVNAGITARNCASTGGLVGGFAGGAVGVAGSGPGGGAAGIVSNGFASGAGGGGHGAPGGDGGTSTQTAATSGGVAYDDAMISILRGGSGGGGGVASGGGGGNGGGAVQLVTNGEIRFDAPIPYFSAIDVQGCPGRAGSDGTGGGGGAGGTVLLEAPRIDLAGPSSYLLATGAGGGGSGPGALDGGFDYLSRGGFNGSNGADGGDGGTREDGTHALAGSAGSNGFSWGGGGGGAIGRLRLNARYTPIMNGSYVPNFDDATTTASEGQLVVE